MSLIPHLIYGGRKFNMISQSDPFLKKPLILTAHSRKSVRISELTFYLSQRLKLYLNLTKSIWIVAYGLLFSQFLQKFLIYRIDHLWWYLKLTFWIQIACDKLGRNFLGSWLPSFPAQAKQTRSKSSLVLTPSFQSIQGFKFSSREELTPLTFQT